MCNLCDDADSCTTHTLASLTRKTIPERINPTRPTTTHTVSIGDSRRCGEWKAKTRQKLCASMEFKLNANRTTHVRQFLFGLSSFCCHDNANDCGAWSILCYNMYVMCVWVSNMMHRLTHSNDIYVFPLPFRFGRTKGERVPNAQCTCTPSIWKRPTQCDGANWLFF